MTKHHAFMMLAGEALESVSCRISDNRGEFSRYDIEELSWIFEAYHTSRKVWLTAILSIWRTLESCNTKHPLIDDQDRAARLALMRHIQAVARRSGVSDLAAIAQAEINQQPLNA